VDRFGVGDFGGADQRRHVQVAEVRRGRADTDGFVGEAHVLGFLVGFRVDDHRLDAELAARALNAQRDFTAVGNEDFFKHSEYSSLRGRANGAWSIGGARPDGRAAGLADHEKRLAVFDGLAVLDEDFLDHAGLVDSISFSSFIASMMHSVWPSLTVSPTCANGSAPGDGAR
jgi:hypothetical protein